MEKRIFIIIILIYSFGFSQLKSVVIDSITKEKIPYVNIWVENEDIGATSDEEGKFELKVYTPKNIVFSAIGFKTRIIKSDQIKDLVQLYPQLTDLKEVVIKVRKLTREFTIGKFKKSKINSYFGCGTKPWMTARFFNYKKDYKNTPFINNITLLTNSDVKNSKFNIRLYDVNDRDEPEGYIYDGNIIGVARKGKRTTEIDISKLNIKFPKKGFFVSVEWLIIEANRHESTYTTEGSKKKHIRVSYEPAIGLVPADTSENSWRYSQGKWKKTHKNNESALRRYRNKYNLLAIELNLTN